MEISQCNYQLFVEGKLEVFYSETYPGLLTYTSQRLGADYGFLAEDCLQDVIFAVYQHRQQIESPLHLRSLLYRALHNKIVSVCRHESLSRDYVEVELNASSEEGPDLANTYIEQETLDRLYRAIDALPDHLRRLFELSFEQGLTNLEVAKLLSISDSTVRRQKKELVETLKEHVADRELMLIMTVFASMSHYH